MKKKINKLIKILIIPLIGLTLGQCSTYSVKKDMSKNGELTKTPKWYIKYKREDKTWMYETASSVSPDMELAVKKSTILAKAKLADRINGKMNNQTTIDKVEKGIDEKMIAVFDDEPEYKHYDSLDNLSEHKLLEIKEFFQTYKNLEKDKWVKVGKFCNKKETINLIEKTHKMYLNKNL